VNKNIFKGLTKNFIGEKMREKIKEIGGEAAEAAFRNCLRILNGEVPGWYEYEMNECFGRAEIKGFDPRLCLSDAFETELACLLVEMKIRAEANGRLTEEKLRKLFEEILDYLEEEVNPGKIGRAPSDKITDIIEDFREKGIERLLKYHFWETLRE
jgi:hypothetical protein